MESGEKKDEAEFHRIVAWAKLAELCSQFLVKGRKVYLEGRLSTRNWNAQDGTPRTSTEIIISDMILLDSKRPDETSDSDSQSASKKKTSKVSEKEKDEVVEEDKAEEIAPDDIPF